MKIFLHTNLSYIGGLLGLYFYWFWKIQVWFEMELKYVFLEKPSKDLQCFGII